MNARIDAAAEAIGQYRPRSAFLTNEDAARKVLAAADEAEAPLVERLAQALRETEWAEVFSNFDIGDFICGSCGNDRNHGHDDGCSVAVALDAFDARRADQ